jgi:hypothetical protein
MANLALGIQQLAAGVAEALHAAFATTPLVSSTHSPCCCQ